MVDQRVLKTIIAEAGGDPKAMAAVAAVINNRAQAQGKTPLQVVKAKGQFEGYSNPGPAISRQLNDAKLLQRAEQVFTGVSSGTIADPTGGGTMYHADYVSPYWAKSANKNGTVNIGGNVFYKGSGSPQTAVAAIDALAPNPQSRPSALGYASTPSSVRAISVNPDGSPASLADALMGKFGNVSNVPRGTTAQSLYGNVGLPPGMPVPRPTGVQQPNALTTRSVNSVPINPNTGNPYTGIELAQQAANTEAARLRGSMPTGRVANIPVIPQPTPSQPNDLQSALNTYATRLAAQKPAPVKTAQSLPEPKVTFSNGLGGGQQTPFERANQEMLVNSLPFGLNLAASGFGNAYNAVSNALTPKPTPATPKPAQKVVASPPATSTPKPLSSGPTPSQLAAINNISGAYQQPITHSAISTQDRIGQTPSPLMAFAGDQNTGLPAGVAAINAATIPLPRPRPVPTVPSPQTTQFQKYGHTLEERPDGSVWVVDPGITPYRTGNVAPTSFPGAPKLAPPNPLYAGGFLANTLPGHIAQAASGMRPQGGLLSFLLGNRNPLTAGVPMAHPAYATQQAPNVPSIPSPPPGNAFLQAQGVNTADMSLGQQQSALMDSIRGAGGGAWH